LETVELVTTVMGGQGDAIADWQGKRVFVPNALPGERVRASLRPAAGGELAATEIEIVDPSPDRIGPARETCGGCTLQTWAAPAYRVFTADNVQPIEIRASDRPLLEQWLSGRGGRSLEIPDLSSLGLRFMGGRLLSTEAGPAGLLMYDNDHGARLVFYLRPVPKGRSPGLHERSEAGVETRFWFDGRYGYAVTGPAALPILGLATEAFRRAYAAT